MTNLGQLPYLPTLQILNVESNQLRTVPPEICLLKNLKSLLIGQNSIRSIPGDIVSGGHVKLMNFLKNRLPDDYEEPNWIAVIKNGPEANKKIRWWIYNSCLLNIRCVLALSVSF